MSSVSDQLLREILEELRELNEQQRAIAESNQRILDNSDAICPHSVVIEGFCHHCGMSV